MPNVTIENAIANLITEFETYPEKFLTEDDVRSYLYHLLLESFNQTSDTSDGEKSIPIHCEVRWYGNGRMKRRSDIVLFDVSSLKTKNTILFKLPSKGYYFDKPTAVIEIKLRRKEGGDSDKKFVNHIKDDRGKLLEITNNGTYCPSYLIVFDKKKNMNFNVIDRDQHKEYYLYPYNHR